MTLDELNEHLALRVELNKAKEQKEAYLQKALPGAQKLTGMPHSPGVSDKVGDMAIEMAMVDDVIEALQKKIEPSEKRVMEFIGRIPDLQTKLVFYYRFVDGLEWKEVPDNIVGLNTTESVKMACYRYLKFCDV